MSSQTKRTPEQPPTGEELPTSQEQERFRRLGLELDELGRPLHPWLGELSADPNTTLQTGKGHYHNWGPNLTADPIAIVAGHVLLITRGDTNEPALPGGHVERDEDPEVTALRELAEETGLVLPAGTQKQLIYRGPVMDPRATMHAWPETSAYLIELPGQDLPEVQGMDDAVNAVWIPLEVAAQAQLYGSHHYLLEQALAHPPK